MEQQKGLVCYFILVFALIQLITFHVLNQISKQDKQLHNEKRPTNTSRIPVIGPTNREVIQIRSLDFSYTEGVKNALKLHFTLCQRNKVTKETADQLLITEFVAQIICSILIKISPLTDNSLVSFDKGKSHTKTPN